MSRRAADEREKLDCPLASGDGARRGGRGRGVRCRAARSLRRKRRNAARRPQFVPLSGGHFPFRAAPSYALAKDICAWLAGVRRCHAVLLRALPTMVQSGPQLRRPAVLSHVPCVVLSAGGEKVAAVDLGRARRADGELADHGPAPGGDGGGSGGAGGLARRRRAREECESPRTEARNTSRRIAGGGVAAAVAAGAGSPGFLTNGSSRNGDGSLRKRPR